MSLLKHFTRDQLFVAGVVLVTGVFALYEWYKNTRPPPPPQQGMFTRSTPYKVHDEPIPMSQWPTTRDGRLVFQPTYDWQEVPDDCVIPVGLQSRMELGGKKYARAIRK